MVGQFSMPIDILSLDDARDVVLDYIAHYNNVRLNSAIGYIAPKAKLEGRDKQIFKERDMKLESAREARKQLRAVARKTEHVKAKPYGCSQTACSQP